MSSSLSIEPLPSRATRYRAQTRTEGDVKRWKAERRPPPSFYCSLGVQPTQTLCNDNLLSKKVRVRWLGRLAIKKKKKRQSPICFFTGTARQRRAQSGCAISKYAAIEQEKKIQRRKFISLIKESCVGENLKSHIKAMKHQHTEQSFFFSPKRKLRCFSASSFTATSIYADGEH